MRKVWAVAHKDIHEAFRSRSTYLYIAILFFLAFSFSGTYNSVINRLTETNANHSEIYETSQAFLINIVYILPIMYSFFVCTIFTAYAVIVEKSKRNIESLMVTPITLKQIWLGKTLAVTVPSVLISLAVSVISYIVLDLVWVVPKVSSFIFPDALSLITAVLIVPIVIATVVSLVIYLQMVVTNPRIPNLAFTAIFLLLFFGANFLTGMGINLNYSLIYVGLAIIIGSVSYILARSLTKERVILSSKV